MLCAPVFLALLLASDLPSVPVVMRAADHAAGPVSPGELVIIKSAGAGPLSLRGAQLDAAGRVTTSLSGMRVFFDSVAAALAYVSSGEMMAGVPYEVAGRKTTQVVVEFEGKRSPPASVEVIDASPALFTLDSTGRGQAAMLNELGCCNSKQNPAAKGSVSVLYATGEGQTNPPGITGNVPFFKSIAMYPKPVLPVQVTVGGKNSEIMYAGEAPHSIAGILQVNFRVPVDAPPGDHVPITLSVGKWRSPDGVTMAVRSAVQRILVIDSNAAELRQLSERLKNAHYYVSTAGSAAEAVGQVQENLFPIDLVLISLGIPEPDRLKIADTARFHWPQVKLVATAPSAGANALRSADLMGAQAIVAQPASSGVLLRKIYELLHLKPPPYVN